MRNKNTLVVHKKTITLIYKCSTTIPADLVSCNIIIDPITFKVTLTLGLCLLVLNISLGFIVNRFGTKSVLSKIGTLKLVIKKARLYI